MVKHMTWADRLRGGLQKTRAQLNQNAGFLGRDLRSYTRDEGALEDLEMALLAADVGGPATADILRSVQASRRPDLLAALSDALIEQLEPPKQEPAAGSNGLTPWFQPRVKPSPVEPAGHVVMVIGVNGVGKTTTIAKLGQHYMEHGKSVMFGAGDTFRAAACRWCRARKAATLPPWPSTPPTSVRHAVPTCCWWTRLGACTTRPT